MEPLKLIQSIYLNHDQLIKKAIDHLVYKLYQLTYNEVKIIDPEYKAIKIE
jgi:hypothetical protein